LLPKTPKPQRNFINSEFKYSANLKVVIKKSYGQLQSK